MNRDEKLTRAAGLPPARRAVAGKEVVCPSEPGGGTWIALNSSGGCLALVNWYSVQAKVASAPVSRGEIIPSVCASAAGTQVDASLGKLPVARMNPFRLIGVFPASREITEWQWDLKQLVRQNHRWMPHQWISSGFDEPGAQHARAESFSEARRQKAVGTLNWLRRLHCSHVPEPGPYSTCMHREDAATVSYTEIVVKRGTAWLRYHAGAPCQAGLWSTQHIHIPVKVA